MYYIEDQCIYITSDEEVLVYTSLERTVATFQTTAWGQVAMLDGGTDDQRKTALQALIHRYWPPVYANLRVRGCNRDKASELTQAFFAEVILGRGLFERAARERGKLRTLILTALRRFEIDQYRRSVSRGEHMSVPLESLTSEDDWMATHADGHSPDDLFDRRWALSILQEAINRCKQHYQKGDRSNHWNLFEARILQPAISDNPPRPLSDLIGEYEFRSEAAAAAAVQTVKRRMITLLHEVVAETVADDTLIDPEVGEVIRLLAL
ncbi:MAG: sigma-70 family RNA polymerase sigma factor [Planctomycetes bacterium]|nr:sigma-70 family RNA polymerase sigma factor [Planctomycetota bacterium]